MIAEKTLESLEPSKARLTVTVESEEARKEYDSLLQQYSKTARIKGFRRGKVPKNILEQKFGESIRSEAGLQIVESSLKEAFEEIEQKPLQFEPPTLEDEVDLKIGSDFTFTVTYDIFPEIQLGSYEGIEVEQSTVAITAADIDRELEQIRVQNAVVVDKDEDALVENEDIVTIDFFEVGDDGESIEGTARDGFSFTIGTGYNRYKIDDELLGAKKDEVRIVEKSFDDDFEDKELAGHSVRLNVQLKQIKRRDLPLLDDELAQDVGEQFKSLDDLKKDIEKRARETADSRIRQRTIDQILLKIVESSTIALPESMVRAELQSSWEGFVQRSGATSDQMLSFISQDGRTQEDLFEEWRPGVERSLRSRLIIDEIAEKEQIEQTQEEMDEAIGEQAERSNMDIETARENLERSNMMGYLQNQIVTRKLLDFLFEKSVRKKGERIKLLDLLQDNQ